MAELTGHGRVSARDIPSVTRKAPLAVPVQALTG